MLENPSLIQVKRVEFKGKVWIGVTLPKRADYIALIRQIEGRVWKREFKLWLLPYSKQAYGQLKASFPGLIHALQTQSPADPPPGPVEQAPATTPVTKPTFAAKPVPPPVPARGAAPTGGTALTSGAAPVAKPVPSAGKSVNSAAGGKVKAALTGSKIVLQLPGHAPDVQFLRSLQTVRWDPASLTWQVSDSAANRRLIEDYFGERLQKMVPKKQAKPKGPSG